MHSILNQKPIFLAIQIKLLNRLVKRQPLEYSLIDEIFSETEVCSLFFEGILFYHVDEVDNHLGLGAMKLLRLVRILRFGKAERLIFRKVLIEPNLHPSLRVYEDHLFTDLEKSSLFVKNFEALKRSFEEVQLIMVRNLVNFLQSQIYFFDIQQSFVNSRAEVLMTRINEILNLINARGTSVQDLTVFQGLIEMRTFLSRLQLTQIAKVIVF